MTSGLRKRTLIPDDVSVYFRGAPSLSLLTKNHELVLYFCFSCFPCSLGEGLKSNKFEMLVTVTVSVMWLKGVMSYFLDEMGVFFYFSGKVENLLSFFSSGRFRIYLNRKTFFVGDFSFLLEGSSCTTFRRGSFL